MALTPTNRYMNTTATFNAVAVTGVKSAQYNEGTEALMEGADFDLYPTTSGVTMINPTITLRVLDAMNTLGTTPVTKHDLVVTVRDFTNGVGAGGGGTTITMTNAYKSQRSADFEYRQLGTQSVSFHAASTDGATSPVAIAAL